MHLIKSTKGQVLVFDDNEILIFNDSSIIREHRIFGMIFIFSLAIFGIFTNLSGEKLYPLISYVILLLYGVIYLYFYFIKNKKVPEQISYSDIQGIDFITSTKTQEIIIYYGKESKSIKFTSENVNINIIKFLESRNSFIVNRRKS
jgi:hypothetical protein